MESFRVNLVSFCIKFTCAINIHFSLDVLSTEVPNVCSGKLNVTFEQCCVLRGPADVVSLDFTMREN
jgi:hypothetical protein